MIAKTMVQKNRKKKSICLNPTPVFFIFFTRTKKEKKKKKAKKVMSKEEVESY